MRTIALLYPAFEGGGGVAHLLGNDEVPGRKDWIENRLKELDQIFAVSVGGFSLMDNHLHLLLRIDPVADSGGVRLGIRDSTTPMDAIHVLEMFKAKGFLPAEGSEPPHVHIRR